MFDIDINNIILANKPLIFNIISVEIGLLAGIWFRSLMIERTPISIKLVNIFCLFSVVLIYLTSVLTFSSWDLPAIAYAFLGLVSVPLAVPAYNGLLAAAPTLIQSLIPNGILQWILQHSKPKPPLNPTVELKPVVTKEGTNMWDSIFIAVVGLVTFISLGIVIATLIKSRNWVSVNLIVSLTAYVFRSTLVRYTNVLAGFKASSDRPVVDWFSDLFNFFLGYVAVSAIAFAVVRVFVPFIHANFFIINADDPDKQTKVVPITRLETNRRVVEEAGLANAAADYLEHNNERKMQ